MNEIQYIEPQQEKMLFSDVCQIIDGARGRIATYVNTEACLTNWNVRHCVRTAYTFSEEDILSATQRQLTWTHFQKR